MVNSNQDMGALRKRHSWPSSHPSRTTHFHENIDFDPFAFFISPASEQDQDINNLSAGIELGKRSKSLSPTLHREKTVLSALTAVPSPTVKLKRWIERMELLCFRRSPRMSERPVPSPDTLAFPEFVIPRSPPCRGRRNVRTGSVHRVTSNRWDIARRRRVWREPSEQIWPVVEEGEDVGLGIVL